VANRVPIASATKSHALGNFLFLSEFSSFSSSDGAPELGQSVVRTGRHGNYKNMTLYSLREYLGCLSETVPMEQQFQRVFFNPATQCAEFQ